MRKVFLAFLLLSNSCAPVLVAPVDQNSSLIIGRIAIDNKYPGTFYGLLPQGLVEKDLEIEVESRDGTVIQKATTREQGYFLLPNLPPNTYYVRRVFLEGRRSDGARERHGLELRRLSFTPVPGKVLYVGTLIVDLSERGLATLKDMREDERAKDYFLQTYGTTQWASRSFAVLGPSPTVAVSTQAPTPERKSITQTGAKTDRPEWKVGDRWRYNWKRVSTNGTLTREIIREDTFAGVPCYVVRVGKNETFFTKDGLGLLGSMSGGKVIFSRDAPYQPLSWPLEVGKEWQNSFTLERIELKSSQTYYYRIVVAGLDQVNVPAGTYDTFKITVYDAYSNRLLNEYWYSPAVKWFVKSRTYEQDGVREEELLSYKVD